LNVNVHKPLTFTLYFIDYNIDGAVQKLQVESFIAVKQAT